MSKAHPPQIQMGGLPSDGSVADNQRVAMAHQILLQLGKSIIHDDRPILHSLKYVPGALTKSDRALNKYLDLVRGFPRSHDSCGFIK